MIGSLRGTLLNKTPGQALVDVQGIGYEIAITLSVYDRLPAIGGGGGQLPVSELMDAFKPRASDAARTRR